MEIRKGNVRDLDSIQMLYDSVNDYLEANINYPGWKKGVYPIREDAERGIHENSLYVVVEEDNIVGSFILRHEPETAYRTVDWGIDLPDNDIYVIYTLVVDPMHQNKGIGNQIMNYIKQIAKEEKLKAVRLDVYEKNLPAIHLYETSGFQYIATVDLGYSSYGLDWFKLYQYLL